MEKIRLHNNIAVDIAVGLSGSSKTWKNVRYEFEDLVTKLSVPVVTQEKYSDFIKANKDEQGKIKDVGGFVGGYLHKGRRTKSSIIHRQLISLDIDFAYPDFWWDFCLLYDCTAVIHSTHKSSKLKPRYRLIIPLDREVTTEEYEPIARKIASDLNIELFDQSTFEVNRLMFWPSISCDAEYYFKYQDGPILSADSILESYKDWHDVTEWPRARDYEEAIRLNISKQEDPTEKQGLIGAFCRANTIQEVIEQYLSDVYIGVGDNRYTYAKGSTAAGAIVYDDKFLYSHHGTDPAGGRLCNAFDLLRIHKFGHLDSDSDSKKSFNAAEEFISKDKPTLRLIAKERKESIKSDFGGPIKVEAEIEEDDSWTETLTANSKGIYDSSADNINIIFTHDPVLKGAYKTNQFDNKIYLTHSVPWRPLYCEDEMETIQDVDYSGIRNYIEVAYGIVSSQKILDAFSIYVKRASFHPIRDYLNSLVWDDVNRVDTLLIDYFGADDNEFTRASIRKALCAAVARIFRPGTKYDMVLVLVGEQATYKSTFVRKLGVDWFSDSFSTFQGKESFEQLQGAWLIEMAELSGLKKAEIEQVKQYISKCEDTYRPAYGRCVETFKRQCVFFGTTNNYDFLHDPTGNRRFNPIDVHEERRTKYVPKDLTREEVDQIWAEALELWRNGEALYFEKEEIAIEARTAQSLHSATDERRGIIEAYLDKLLPNDWDSKDIYDRRNWLDDPLAKTGTIKRDKVCIAEIWTECLREDNTKMTRYNTKEIHEIMKTIPGWCYVSTAKRFKNYGAQKYYTRK